MSNWLERPSLTLTEARALACFKRLEADALDAAMRDLPAIVHQNRKTQLWLMEQHPGIVDEAKTRIVAVTLEQVKRDTEKENQ